MIERNVELGDLLAEGDVEEEEESTRQPVVKCPDRWKKRILLTNPRTPSDTIDLLQKNWDIHVLPASDRNSLLRFGMGMEGIILDDPSLCLDKDFFKVCGIGLKAISIVGRSVHQIDLNEVKKRNIKVGICPSELSLENAAEVALCAAIILLKRFREGNDAVTSGNALIDNPVWMIGRDIKECCIGIVGLGKLGSTIAVRLLGFGPRKMVYYSRRVKKAGHKFAIERVLLEELYLTSDVIFVCVPANDKTRGMINNAAITRMKPSTIVINVSHGALYNYDDLYCALKRGQLNAAALDSEVYDAPSPRHPIYKLDNFLMLPEVSRNSAYVRVRMFFSAVKNMNNWANKGVMMFPLINEIAEEVETEEERQAREAEELRLRLEEEKRLMEEGYDELQRGEQSSMYLLNVEHDDDIKLPP